MCDGRNHPLEVIYEHEQGDESHVVRWCPDCGSIVVDFEMDGRVAPGGMMPLRSPTYKGLK